MKKITYLIMLSALWLHSCVDHDDIFTYMPSEKVAKKIIAKGNGKWNIDEIKLWVLDLNNKDFIYETERTNAGTITFSSLEKMDIHYSNDTIDGYYFVLASITDMEWDYLGGSIECGYGLIKVLSADKKKMTLFCPASLSYLETHKHLLYRSIEFQMKLTKK